MKHYEAFSHVSGRDYEYQWLKAKRYAHYKLSNSAPIDVLFLVGLGWPGYLLSCVDITYLTCYGSWYASFLSQSTTDVTIFRKAFIFDPFEGVTTVSFGVVFGCSVAGNVFAEFHKSSLPA